MKNNKLLLLAGIFLVSACGINNTRSAGTADSSDNGTNTQTDHSGKGLYATMQIKDTIQAGGPLELKFTVHNQADTAQQFCKWHTPFEPLMSKYLTITDENGTEADYRGAMAKRFMPPPADSYIRVGPNDSLVAVVDLLKGYALNKPSRYTITYSGQNMSGLRVNGSVSFIYRQPK